MIQLSLESFPMLGSHHRNQMKLTETTQIVWKANCFEFAPNCSNQFFLLLLCSLFYLLQTGEKVKVPDSCESVSSTMDTLQVDDGFHSDGGLTPPPSPSSSGSSSSIISTTSDSVSQLFCRLFLVFLTHTVTATTNVVCTWMVPSPLGLLMYLHFVRVALFVDRLTHKCGNSTNEFSNMI